MQYDGPYPPAAAEDIGKSPVRPASPYDGYGHWLMAYHRENPQWVYLICKGGRLARRELIFGKPRPLPFEGQAYPIPAAYKGFITMQYGNYMTPPPTGERGGHNLRIGDIEWKV